LDRHVNGRERKAEFLGFRLASVYAGEVGLSAGARAPGATSCISNDYVITL
jgi:hypothetical protein